ncbi:hypothetical protein BKA70DRAFT_1410135 [Coprinopsis sp. MPI-PUGE-AT-0042]|nr:hypothetical protein BKA70DRAFT_1410135 [Coprinopsis sp. MPI-PUGE-AT-0042]
MNVSDRERTRSKQSQQIFAVLVPKLRRMQEREIPLANLCPILMQAKPRNNGVRGGYGKTEHTRANFQEPIGVCIATHQPTPSPIRKPLVFLTTIFKAVLGATAVLQHLPVVFTRNSGKQGKRFAAVQRGNRVLRKGITDGAKGYGKSDGCGYEETGRLTLLALATFTLLHTHPNEQVFRHPCLFIRLSTRRLSQPRDGSAPRVGTLQDGFDVLELGRLGSEIDDQVHHPLPKRRFKESALLLRARSGFVCEADRGEYKNEDEEAGKREKEIKPPSSNVAPQDPSLACVLENATTKKSLILLAKAAKTYIQTSAQYLSVMLQCFSDGLGNKRSIGFDAQFHYLLLLVQSTKIALRHPGHHSLACFNAASAATTTTPKTDDSTGQQRTRLWIWVSPRRTLLKTYARYVGEDRRELWPWVGVEVGFRIRSSLRKLTSN